MISSLPPPARKARRPFRWFLTDHGDAQTSTTADCRVAGSIARISSQHRLPHPVLVLITDIAKLLGSQRAAWPSPSRAG
jgi:hypothetical protein